MVCKKEHKSGRVNTRRQTETSARGLLNCLCQVSTLTLHRGTERARGAALSIPPARVLRGSRKTQDSAPAETKTH